MDRRLTPQSWVTIDGGLGVGLGAERLLDLLERKPVRDQLLHPHPALAQQRDRIAKSSR